MGVVSLNKLVAISHPSTRPMVLFIAHIYRKPKHLSLGLVTAGCLRLQGKGREGREAGVSEPSVEDGWLGQGRLLASFHQPQSLRWC